MSCLSADLPEIPHGHYDEEFRDLLIGESIKFKCLGGYLPFKGSLNAKVTCESIGGKATWVVKTTCHPISCGVPKIIDNARIIGNVFTFPNKVIYKCDEDYKQFGFTNVFCSASGTWQPPNVNVKCIKCPEFNIENGYFQYDKGDALITCNEGFDLVGEKRRICNIQGKWEGPKPICVSKHPIPEPSIPKSCDKFDNFENGTVTYAGNIAIFECNPGSSIIGSSSIKCDNGKWKGKPPVCIPTNCPLLPSIENGFFQYVEGRSALYECNEGYTLVGIAKRTCSSNTGTWSESTPSCEKIKIPCPELQPIQNGFFHYLDSPKNSNAEYGCNEGYSLQGNIKRTCSDAGIWSGSTPSCKKLKNPCPNLEPIQNGFFRYSEDDENLHVMYECEKGYALEGNEKRTCNNAGIWTGSKPLCKKIKVSCPDLAPLKNGIIHYLDNAFNVEYKCNKGYSLVGNAKRTCNDSGTWTGNAPLCEKQNLIYNFIVAVILLFIKILYFMNVVYNAIEKRK